MRRPHQLSFTGQGFKKINGGFGGSLLKNSHAKVRRPLSSRFAIHVVMRSRSNGMRRPRIFGQVQLAVKTISGRHGIRIYNFANVGNHLHLLIKIPHVRAWPGFIRELSGRISQLVQNLWGPETGRSPFWSQRPFTRVVPDWGRAYRTVKQYVQLNLLEGDGLISRRDFRTLRDLRDFFSDG